MRRGTTRRAGRFRRAEYRSAELPKYLPWLFITEDGFVMTKNSLLLAIFEIIPEGDFYSPGNDAETANMWNNLLMSLPEGTHIWYETQKHTPIHSGYPEDSEDFPGAAARKLEKLREEYFSVHHDYMLTRYLTVSFTPSIGKTGILRESIDGFEDILIDLKSRFSSVRIRAERLAPDGICTYLHSCISSKRYDIAAPSAAFLYGMSEALWDEDIDTTSVPLRLGSRYISIISISDLPASGTVPEMLNSVISVPGNIRWVSRFTVKGLENAKKQIDLRRRQYHSRRFSARDIAAQAAFNAEPGFVDTTQLNLQQECEMALADLGSNVSFGYFSGAFILESESEEELQRMVKDVEEKLSYLYFVHMNEELNLFAAWIGYLPGNFETNPRKQFISTGNLACLVSLTAPYRGEKVNQHLLSVSGCGLPNAIGILSDGSFYNLNLNGREDRGHTFVLGPTGAGKSLLLAFLAAQFTKYPGSRVIYFDKGISSKRIVEGNGGVFFHPGKDSTTFQPLRNAQTHIERCQRFLSSIASVQGIKLSPNEMEEITDALMLLVPGHENLSIFRRHLMGKNHDSPLVAALSLYSGDGPWGPLFDAESDALDPSSWPLMTAIEMGELMEMGDSAIIPALAYLTSQLTELFEDRRPTLLILDEAWVYMKHPVFREYISEWLRTLRKYNVFVVLATQEVTDFDELVSSVLTNCHTKIILPNSSASTGPMADLYRKIGLTETDIYSISNVRLMQPKRHYYVIQPEGNAIIDFRITDEQLDYLR